MQMEQFQIQIKIKYVMYMIWLITVMNGQQKPIAIPTFRAWDVEVVATLAASTLAIVTTTVPLLPTVTIPSDQYFI